MCGADPPSWVLKIAGKIVDPGTSREAANGAAPGVASGAAQGLASGAAPRPAQCETAPLMQHIKRLRVQLDEAQYPGAQGILDWDRTKHAGQFKQQLEIRSGQLLLGSLLTAVPSSRPCL